MGILNRILNPLVGNTNRLQAARDAGALPTQEEIQTAGQLPGFAARDTALTAAGQQFLERDPSSFRGQQEDLVGQLKRRAAGQDSLARLQFQQARGNLANQQLGQVAGLGRGGNRALAGRIAAQNIGTGNQALAGQEAVARLGEQQSAQNVLQGLLQGARGQDQSLAQLQQQGFLQAQNQAAQNAQSQQRGALQSEQLRQQQLTSILGTPTEGEQLLGGIMGGLQGAATVGKAFSDRRLKRKVKKDKNSIDDFMNKLQAYSYEYKNSSHGAGKQLGVMAQDLEKAGLNQAVINTPEGKMVHGAKLAGALAAATARLNERLNKVEKRG